MTATIQAVILAAGRGVRMRPVTDAIPKPLIPIHGKPFIDYLIENLLRCGFREQQLIVVTGYLKEMIHDHLAERFPRVAAAEQPSLDGTAGALYTVLSQLPSEPPVLMMMGDNYYSRRDIAAMIATGPTTIGCQRSATPEKYGVVLTRSANQRLLVSGLLEKPAHLAGTGSALISTGLHLFGAEAYPLLRRLVLQRRHTAPGAEIPLTDVIAQLAQTHPIAVTELHDWQDMGCPSDIAVMERLLAKIH